ncbi:GNAT family N-acetyltransferase [Aridibaculum aurantiacum]|uniref:GNAT family N-acetyltransferase n=1 Tax=Aridibaculum aurantiacum TaxID=2810307 RepID=UPI001A970F78|nr:GNAT family N-acetyltransferase [Aridibaculum aurantiacum]
MVAFDKYGLSLRTVVENDADFIVQLRTDPKLSKHLSSTSTDIEKQKEWIRDYKERELHRNEYYFLISSNEGPVGLNRLYNFKEDTFEIGSWLFKPTANEKYSILGDLAARDYGFEELHFSFCTFEVRKENKSVLRYHKQFKPEAIGVDSDNFYFKLSYNSYKCYRDKLLSILL